MYHHGETIELLLWWNKENDSELKDSQSLNKPSPSWATVGLSKGKHQAVTHQWKISAKVVILSDS